MTIYIRNMACESCKVFVREALTKLKLHPLKVELGEAEIKESLGADNKKKLNTIIKKVGLEIIENKSGIIIEQIKKNCHEYAYSEKQININISEYISEKLKLDYNYISSLFSETQACTIVHYINLLKMERAKEMILFEDLSLSEIADKLNYHNLSNFSAQFKKITGYNPSHFKNLKIKRRLTIQELNEFEKS